MIESPPEDLGPAGVAVGCGEHAARKHEGVGHKLALAAPPQHEELVVGVGGRYRLGSGFLGENDHGGGVAPHLQLGGGGHLVRKDA